MKQKKIKSNITSRVVFIVGLVSAIFIFGYGIFNTAQAAQIYACVANDGKYACSPSNKSDLSDTSACAGKTAVQIDSSKCGQSASAAPAPTQTIPPTTALVPGAVNAIDCTKTPNAANCLYNPLPTGDLVTFVLLIMKWVLGLIGIFTVIFIMIGGFRMVMSQGNEEAYGVAKKTITYAIIGLVVAVLSFSMVAIVQSLLQSNIQQVSNTTGSTP
jgi:hypothetical protein